jgi:hypothetical protein
MPGPLTADERHRRVVQYLETLNKGQLANFQLGRMNRVSNFRKALIQLMEQFIEARAEELCAAWLQQYAAPRPREDVAEGRLPLPQAKKRRMPVWVKRAVEAEKSRRYAQKY